MLSDNIAKILPKKLLFAVNNIPRMYINDLSEIRLYRNNKLSLSVFDKNIYINETGAVCSYENGISVHDRMFDETLSAMTEYSMYAYDDVIKQGYIPLGNGTRAGVCGDYVTDPLDLSIRGIKKINSINIRISRFVPLFATRLIDYYNSNGIMSTIVVSPPSCGKTTLLRSAAHMLSSGIGIAMQKIGIADERNEIYIAEKMRGLCDVVSGMKKSNAVNMLTRSMSPQVIICDELCRDDCEPLLSAANGGVSIIASAHGLDITEVMKRPFINEMISQGLFSAAVSIQKNKGFEYDISRLD